MKHEYMLWSPQIEEDCANLLSEGETDGDAILVAMARISRVLIQIAELNRHMYDHPESTRHTSLHIPLLKSSLEQVKSTLSEQQEQHSNPIHTLVSLYLPTNSHGSRSNNLPLCRRPLHLRTRHLRSTQPPRVQSRLRPQTHRASHVLSQRSKSVY